MRGVVGLVRGAVAVLLAALALSTILRGDWLALTLVLIGLLAVATPRERLPRGPLHALAHPVARTVLVLLALGAFFGVVRVGTPDSIYHSPEVRQRFLELYDAKMADWPVPFDDRYIATEYGAVHVVESGPMDGPPLLLLHASGVGSWSWKYNVEALSHRYRTYAIDLIGDAGKSELDDLSVRLESKADQARLYAEITDSLGAPRAFVVGASEGGFVATSYALQHPERVAGLVLVGPMGYAGAVGAIARIMLTALFPVRWLQERTFAWAFSDNPALQEDFGEWFRLVMTGVTPAKVAPLPFSAEERRQLSVPVLFIFGQRDHLVGDPEVARALVQDIPGVDVAVVNAGHLAAAEAPGTVNRVILEFLEGL